MFDAHSSPGTALMGPKANDSRVPEIAARQTPTDTAVDEALRHILLIYI